MPHNVCCNFTVFVLEGPFPEVLLDTTIFCRQYLSFQFHLHISLKYFEKNITGNFKRAEGEIYKNTRVKHEEKLCDCAPLQINRISARTFDLVWHILKKETDTRIIFIPMKKRGLFVSFLLFCRIVKVANR